MQQFLQYTILGLVVGGVYFIAASGPGGDLHDVGHLQLRPGRHRHAVGVHLLAGPLGLGLARPDRPAAGAVRLRPAARRGALPGGDEEPPGHLRGHQDHRARRRDARLPRPRHVDLEPHAAHAAALLQVLRRQRHGRASSASTSPGTRSSPSSLAIAIAGGIAFLFRRTRSGVAMRAVVDDPDLLQLNGGRPERLATISWAGGAFLAALAGILITPIQGTAMSANALTLLVIDAFAAAMFGRLKSLPRTFVGRHRARPLHQLRDRLLPGEQVDLDRRLPLVDPDDPAVRHPAGAPAGPPPGHHRAAHP